MLNANRVTPLRRTATVGLAIALALGGGLVASSGTVSAAMGSVSIGNGGADGELGAGFGSSDGDSWAAGGLCRTGRHSIDEYRFALEFPLAALPAGVTITGATLSLRTNDPEGAGPTAIYGYAGDGEITPPDVEVSGIPVTFTPTSLARESYDVTAALLTTEVLDAGWAGFSLRQEPLGTSFGTWTCPQGSAYPILAIAYSLPDADADGVLDAADLCADTELPDLFLQLQKNRYAATGAGALVSELKNAPTYTLDDTAGCSASQIIALGDAGAGHERFGLSRSLLEAFIADQQD